MTMSFICRHNTVAFKAGLKLDLSADTTMLQPSGDNSYPLKSGFLTFIRELVMGYPVIEDNAPWTLHTPKILKCGTSVPVVHCRTLVVVNITTLAVMAAPGPTVEVHKHLDYHSDVSLPFIDRHYNVR